MRHPFLLMLTALLIVSSPAFAAKKTAPQASSSVGRGIDGPEIGIAGRLPVISGTLGPGFQFQFITPLYAVPGLSFGGETGLWYWGRASSYTVTTPAGTTTSGGHSLTFPLLGTAIYRFNKKDARDPNFYGGASIGFAFTSSSYTTGSGVTEVTVKGSSTDLAVLFRPGFEFGGENGRQFYVEPTLGFVSDTIIFMPTFGMSFPL